MTSLKTRARPRLHKDECARLGKQIYERDILPLVEDDHDGEFVSIDVHSGKWAVADTGMKSTALLRAKSPDATDVWREKVGYVAAGSLGGGAPPRRKKARE